ncbi:MAG: 16S rRNA (uracil(1498)-N(3))-methyltransferase [Campylobacteraceae bacterium]|jgi:16S rRNA (uracil1498-N3)-methyltransferase|nr:16S rRNA (uracil(1498)-N(3))-methyltransferase [Campylobacteraceae bacterium]MBT3882491.1 16S rRNA (uracil(1498)-N(3))-methyltransferase [Campylobacteraceae bacterium]MBT4030484.1 16S rRNA (uracil(1498)-N(3))-methyltransferase [Campylobacteraceae bacterium]MBT4179525.1 16S rRNA (uracil(1498)-N(3))-methyltransferase [Campylobacteraceae bacterium]MBT4572191.1 16S rRNA (uracil(1498)-N(3))-methyltransferase [Campylobacteraceae bacterium]
MQFTYHINSGDPILTIDGDLHKYLFKVRRHDKNQNIYFRNLINNNIYEYKIDIVDKRKTTLTLVSFEEKTIQADKKLHIGWCVIDPKSIEKQIASLNELGIEKITFIYCEYSQYKYKVNIEKLEKLLINSSQQSGRSNIIQLEQCESLESFLEQNPASYMFNFSSNHIDTHKDDIDTIIIGCEGGFSNNEITNVDNSKIVGIHSNIILRSETAAVTVASKILV